jgi:HSF-type DNA-binding
MVKFIPLLYREAIKGDLVRFNATQGGIIIGNRAIIPGSVLSKTSRDFTSFQRQLNLYDVIKIGPDTWYHPHFFLGSDVRLVVRNTDSRGRKKD